MGFIAAFLVVILLTAGIYLFGYSVRQSSLLQVLLLETILGIVVIFLLLVFVDKLTVVEIFTKSTSENWIWLGAAALFGYVGGNYFSLMNLKAAGERANSLLSPAITVVSLIFSFFIFRETLSARQWIGVLIVIIAVVFFLIKDKKTNTVVNKKLGFIGGVMTILLISLTIICSIKGADNNVTLLQAIWIRLLIALAFIVVAIIFFGDRNTLKKQPPQFYVIITLAVIFQTVLGSYLWFYGSFKIGIGLFQVILATIPFCVYAVDVFILKKRANAILFLVVSVLAAAGVCLVLL